MGYKCKNCGLGIIIVPEKEPLRACTCTRTVEENGIKVIKPEAIVADMDAVAVSKSSLRM